MRAVVGQCVSWDMEANGVHQWHETEGSWPCKAMTMAPGMGCWREPDRCPDSPLWARRAGWFASHGHHAPKTAGGGTGTTHSGTRGTRQLKIDTLSTGFIKSLVIVNGHVCPRQILLRIIQMRIQSGIGVRYMINSFAFCEPDEWLI